MEATSFTSASPVSGPATGAEKRLRESCWLNVYKRDRGRKPNKAFFYESRSKERK